MLPVFSRLFRLPARLFVPDLTQDGMTHYPILAIVQEASKPIRWVPVIPVLSPQFFKHDLF